ncbi:ankyrin repeat domain family member sosondowah isoform X1 [Amblyomma americanum]
MCCSAASPAKHLAAATRSAILRLFSGAKGTYSVHGGPAPKAPRIGPTPHAETTARSLPPIAASCISEDESFGSLDRLLIASREQRGTGKRSALSHLLNATRYRYNSTKVPLTGTGASAQATPDIPAPVAASAVRDCLPASNMCCSAASPAKQLAAATRSAILRLFSGAKGTYSVHGGPAPKAPRIGPTPHAETTARSLPPIAASCISEAESFGSRERLLIASREQRGTGKRSALSHLLNATRYRYNSTKVPLTGTGASAQATPDIPAPVAASAVRDCLPASNMCCSAASPAKQRAAATRSAILRLFSGAKATWYHVRQRFKDFVNRLASVKEENGTKYLILRNEYFEELQSSRREFTVGHNGAMEETDSSVGVMQQDHADYFAPSQGQTLKHLQWRQFTQDYPMIGDECPPLSPVGASRIRSSPCLLDENCYEDVPPPLPKKKNSFGGSPKRPDMPLPPPRGRKNHGRRGSQVEERVRQFSVEKELEGNVSPKEKTIQDVTVSPGTVKEKTQIINRMAESSGVPAKPALPSSGLGTITSKRREGPGARAAPDDDTTSVNTLDPRRREWLLRAAQTDYHSLVRLLREDPDLYRFEDFTSVCSKHFDVFLLRAAP